ncbi:peptide/nickel transport system permease protein [Arthrobacter sp. SLBN-100]|uniref:dipeptide/oligopeptide/nickel ABC transporter permease/ATP-binding protein n=1 Tax=Arthrobacter sp. SLBN-100 TaxID=2768450 RepID=UPI00114E1518|nr:dipeptide/oligopeptide/nickel ABC transporter permease/ATP-binding protein [Arthrobacter sp. SLBN-100]TQJ66265.1 peptide/nickel transport system permease protein [Arthrobacter sp. SLBN-100]
MSSETPVEPLVTLAEQPTSRKPSWRRLLEDPQGLITVLILLAIIVFGLLAPVLAEHDPNAASLQAANAPMGTPDYPMGADQSGRDILSRLLHSINTSMISAVIGTGVALLVGITFGLVGGYFAGTRSVTEWVFNLIMTFPGLLMLIVLMPVTKGDFRATMLIFGFLLSPGIYRIVRNQVIGVSRELYVDAARVSGLKDLRILARHVLPIVRGPVIIAAAFLASASIGVQAGLAFLGVGSNSVPSFGSMISVGFTNLYISPLQFIWPSLVLGILTACLVLFGNALRDTLQGAKQKRRRRSGPAPEKAAMTPPRDQTATLAESPLLVVKDLVIAYPSPTGELNEVVQGVSFSVNAGETLGVVGESGSGKTQTAFAVLGVLPHEAVILRGSVRLMGRELLGLNERELRKIRGRDIAYIPQEPMSNLDPSFTVGAQLIEGIRATSDVSAAEAENRAMELLGRVGIRNPERTFASYPHQISGGMAQRVLIAGAVASRPRLLIADEPTTALDVTVQAEILDLLRDLQQELGMAVLLVTHNFGVVADICDRVSVMRNGEIVETGDTVGLFRSPKHDYTRMLLNSILDESVVRLDPPVTVGADEAQR